MTLDRLASKGYVSSTVGDANAGRGGRPKRYFRVTRDGTRAVLESRRAFANLWEGLDGVLEEA